MYISDERYQAIRDKMRLAVPTPAFLFCSDGRSLFPVIGTHGAYTATLAAFIFWKNDGLPRELNNIAYQFPTVEGVEPLADGGLVGSLFFSMRDFEDEAYLIRTLAIVELMKQMAGKENWSRDQSAMPT